MDVQTANYTGVWITCTKNVENLCELTIQIIRADAKPYFILFPELCTGWLCE